MGHVPQVITIDRIVETPEIQVVEKLEEVVHPVYQFVDKIVPKVEVQERVRRVQVPQVVSVDKIAEQPSLAQPQVIQMQNHVLSLPPPQVQPQIQTPTQMSPQLISQLQPQVSKQITPQPQPQLQPLSQIVQPVISQPQVVAHMQPFPQA